MTDGFKPVAIPKSNSMSSHDAAPVTPSQIRAGRALLDWSQETLAAKAKVGLSTVRDYEKERRGGEAGATLSIRQALEAGGVVFISGDAEGNGPGVRLYGALPNVLRRPTKLGRFDALVFDVEWRGRKFEVFLSQEALDDLGGFHATQPEAVYLDLFDDRRARILTAAAKAVDSGRVEPDRRVYLKTADFPPRGG